MLRDEYMMTIGKLKWQSRIQLPKKLGLIQLSKIKDPVLVSKIIFGLVQWHTPVVPCTWRLRQEDHLSPTIQDQSAQHSKISILKTIAKNYLWWATGKAPNPTATQCFTPLKKFVTIFSSSSVIRKGLRIAMGKWNPPQLSFLLPQ